MATEAIRRAVKKYDAANTVQFHLKLNKNTDADIIEILDGVDNVQGYIKQLIRAEKTAFRSQNGSQDDSESAGNHDK